MRRIGLVLAIIALIFALSAPALAASGATGVQYGASISSDGSCRISVSVSVHLDEALSELIFPVPGTARSITLNGDSARSQRSGDVLLIDLTEVTGGYPGDYSFNILYTLDNVVSENENGLPEVELPILSGFSYPVEKLDFTVTLPRDPENQPAFSSGYHQQRIESDLVYEINGNQISGSLAVSLKDHETLSMTLVGDDEMFPRDAIHRWTASFDDIALLVCVVLALLYWLLFMRCAPLVRRRCTHPPEGFTAGELGCALTGQGADLSMMVLSWAQLGYLLIHLEDSGRVMLHKRMDMGNERGLFEVRTFQKLFGKRKVVDGTGYHYARLCRSVAAARSDLRELFHRKTGSPRIFRLLSALAGVFGGLSLGLALGQDGILVGLLGVLMAILGGIASWLIQNWVRGLHLRNRLSLILALIAGGIWILLGIAAQEAGIAIGVVAWQFLAGLAAAYGGRRTAVGRQTAGEILGLRQYLSNASSQQMQHIIRSQPDYFFTLAPCALALGVGSSFARRFGSKRLSACPWLTSGMDGHMTALEWCRLMERALRTLDYRQKRLPLERLLGK